MNKLKLPRLKNKNDIWFELYQNNKWTRYYIPEETADPDALALHDIIILILNEILEEIGYIRILKDPCAYISTDFGDILIVKNTKIYSNFRPSLYSANNSELIVKTEISSSLYELEYKSKHVGLFSPGSVYE